MPTISLVLWWSAIVAVLPGLALVTLLPRLPQRRWSLALAALVLACGIATSGAWLIHARGDLPGTAVGNTLFLLAILVPVAACARIWWSASSLADEPRLR